MIPIPLQREVFWADSVDTRGDRSMEMVRLIVCSLLWLHSFALPWFVAVWHPDYGLPPAPSSRQRLAGSATLRTESVLEVGNP